jgi:preprotein translocase subunit SecG
MKRSTLILTGIFVGLFVAQAVVASAARQDQKKMAQRSVANTVCQQAACAKACK